MTSTHIASLDRVLLDADGHSSHSTADCPVAHLPLTPVAPIDGGFYCGTCIDVDADLRPRVEVVDRPLPTGPARGTRTTTTVPADAATERQVAYLVNLANERNLPVNIVGLSKKEASAEIDRLLAIPKPAKPAPAPAPKPAPAKPAVDVPDGYYAIPSATGNNDLDFYRVDTVEKGDWAGFKGVNRVIGGHSDQRVTRGERYRALERIAAYGIDAARHLYADNLERCFLCNKHLTDLESRKAGMGPDCRNK